MLVSHVHAGVDKGGGGLEQGQGPKRGVYKLLKVWRNQKFFKSFLWYINMSLSDKSEMRDETR